MTQTTERPHTFTNIPGDHATWAVNDPEAAIRMALSSPFIAVDIETGPVGTPRRWDVKAVAISNGSEAVALDPLKWPGAIREALTAAKRLVFHNAPYDVPALYLANMLTLDDLAKTSDTLVSARLAWSDFYTMPNDLGSLAERVLGPGYKAAKDAFALGWKAATGGSKASMFDALTLDNSSAYGFYACYDVIMTARVFAALPGRVHEALNPGLPGFRPADAAYLDEREQVVNRVLLRRSCLGIEWDVEAAESVTAELSALAGAQRLFLGSQGIDPDLAATPLKQAVLARLEAAGKVPSSWPRLKNGNLTTSKTWMSKLDESPLIGAVGTMLQADRWVRDYADGSIDLVHRGRVHPQVNVQGTVAGRMTYSRPNLQQYPPAVRRLLRFEWPVTSFDWSSIEPVVVAALSHDETVYAAYEAGEDLYQPIADRAGVDRKTAKVVLLAQLYGQGVASLALRLNCSEGEARLIVAAVRGAMPNTSKMIAKVRGYGDQIGFIQTISGRVVPLQHDPSTGNRRFFGYKGVNYLVQGSALDLLSESIYAMHQAGLGDALAVAVHDELVVASEVAADVERIMTTPPAALVQAAGRVPVLRVGRADLGTNWAEK